MPRPTDPIPPGRSREDLPPEAARAAIERGYRAALASGDISGPDLPDGLDDLAEAAAGRVFVLGLHRSDPADPACWTGVLGVASDGERFSIHEASFADPRAAHEFRRGLIEAAGGEEANLVRSNAGRERLVLALAEAGLRLVEHAACTPEEVVARAGDAEPRQLEMAFGRR